MEPIDIPNPAPEDTEPGLAPPGGNGNPVEAVIEYRDRVGTTWRLDRDSGTALVGCPSAVHVLYLCEIRSATTGGKPSTDGTVMVSVDMRDGGVFFSNHIGFPDLATARHFLRDLAKALR